MHGGARRRIDSVTTTDEVASQTVSGDTTTLVLHAGYSWVWRSGPHASPVKSSGYIDRLMSWVNRDGQPKLHVDAVVAPFHMECGHAAAEGISLPPGTPPEFAPPDSLVQAALDRLRAYLDAWQRGRSRSDFWALPMPGLDGGSGPTSWSITQWHVSPGASPDAITLATTIDLHFASGQPGSWIDGPHAAFVTFALAGGDAPPRIISWGTSPP